LGAVNLSAFRGPGAGRGDYIDGEVVEGEIVDGESGGASYGGGNLPIVR